MKYAALIFDIVESRDYQDRYNIQNIMIKVVNYLNHLYKEGIKKEVIPSAGDEFQGLFLNLQSAFLYIKKLQLLVYPIKVRCGIGYGEIKYDVEDWTSSALDGEAYYLARDAINQVIKKKDDTIVFNIKNVFDKYLNMLCFTSGEIKNSQSQVALWIELLADIILPIKQVDENISVYNFILEMQQKIIVSEETKAFEKAKLEMLNTDFQFLFNAKDKIHYKENGNGKLYDEEFWAYGMSTAIAKAMGTSRQNIDRYISLGKIKDRRKIDKTIYEFLGEQIW